MQLRSGLLFRYLHRGIRGGQQHRILQPGPDFLQRFMREHPDRYRQLRGLRKEVPVGRGVFAGKMPVVDRIVDRVWRGNYPGTDPDGNVGYRRAASFLREFRPVRNHQRYSPETYLYMV
jgi:hypothetical protein